MEDHEKRIIDYCDGSMDPREKEAFEMELEKNAGLKQLVVEYLELITAVESKEFIKQLPEEINSITRKKLRSYKWILPIAATVLVFVFIYGPFSSHDKLLKELFHVDPGLITPMSTVSQYQFYDGMVEYKLGNYNQALEKWSIEQDEIGPDTVTYYRAMAKLNLGELNEAFQLLDQITNSALYQKKVWYQLYIRLEQKKMQDAENLFHVLPENSPNYDKIKEYLHQ